MTHCQVILLITAVLFINVSSFRCNDKYINCVFAILLNFMAIEDSIHVVSGIPIAIFGIKKQNNWK